MMRLAVPKEIEENETRVALIPQSVKKFTQKGIEVVVESNAGISAGFKDKNYEDAGAKIEKAPALLYGSADLITKIRVPITNNKLGRHEVDLMKEGSVLVSLLYPYTNLEVVKKLTERKISAFSLDSLPRITLAQSMDVLSSMTTITGYKAVLIAASVLPKFFPMLMTAAGTVSPAKVFIIGAGVAGLQAIATARRLGAIVEAFDTRPAVKEQIESLGARFVELDLSEESTEDSSGYAKELSKASHKKELELIKNQLRKSDVVITTALIPGKKAPILITEDMVKEMQQGSVIVDLASEQGGNCELTEPGKQIVRHGITISGFLNLPATMPNHASQMFSKNIEAVIAHLVKDNKVNIDLNDEINKGSLITSGGNILHEGVKQHPARVN